jgi:hypothetical protein
MDKLFSLENIKSGGIAGLLLLILVTGFSGTWVYGPLYTKMEADRDEWKKVALQGLQVARQVSPERALIGAAPPTIKVEGDPKEVMKHLDEIRARNAK